MAAQKIADILGGNPPSRSTAAAARRSSRTTSPYDGADAVAIGLRGHVMETMFPEHVRRWSLKYLGDMIEKPDLAWVVDGGAAGTLAALRAAAKGATELVIATDYDREGELIGHEALEILRGDALKHNPDDKPEKKKRKSGGQRRPPRRAPRRRRAEPVNGGDPHVKPMLPAAVVDRHIRVRYSALTPKRCKAAFAKPSTVDFNLAEAAHSRQDIDLIWGAVLTRFMSLASYRYGSDYLSVGRVQSPTLRLVVDRELERPAFVPVPYWELKATLERDGDRVEVAHAKGRFDDARRPWRPPSPARTWRPAWSPPTRPSRVRRSRRRRSTPPALMSAASGAGMTPARAMRAAESLYLDGLISYPRTDNTVYPPSLDLHGSLRELSRLAAGRRHGCAAGRRRTGSPPTRGKKRTTDHPPIYPVGAPKKALERRPGQGLRPGRAALPRHAAAGGRHRAPARRRQSGAEPFLAYGARVADARVSRGLREVRGQARPAAAAAAAAATSSTCSTCALRPRRRSLRAATARASSSRRWKTSASVPRRPAPTSSSTSTTATTCATTRWSPPSSAWPSSPRSMPPWTRRRSTSPPVR